ncbi:hypothetical protein ANN_04115 [Periplaneta americana]|uniref:Reverse transcriptase domain-containing protein n=1 Tax=Periplaneta americana TaxID=6978 RepID=A0ABQ8T7P0_PERAM|nr:hypothetical protein ANN_04115 [Periplaneta americana]
MDELLFFPSIPSKVICLYITPVSSNSSRGKGVGNAVDSESLMLAGNEFQSLGRAIVKEDEYEEVRWDGIVSIVSWRERVFRSWWEERVRIGGWSTLDDDDDDDDNDGGDLLGCFKGTGAVGENFCVTWTTGLSNTNYKSGLHRRSNPGPQDYKSSALAARPPWWPLFGYADDVIITGRRIQDVEEALIALDKETQKLGFKINTKKSKFMSVTKRQNDQVKEVKMGTYKFEKVKEFTYLGSILTANNDLRNYKEE